MDNGDEKSKAEEVAKTKRSVGRKEDFKVQQQSFPNLCHGGSDGGCSTERQGE